MNNKQWGNVYNKANGTAHCLPLNDLELHSANVKCWCKPRYTGEGVYLHNSKDGREAFETGERKLS